MPLTVTCPLCRQPLLRGPASWHCAGGHAFDVARDGYVNLLPAQHRKSRAPGDNADMVRARREFLDAGHYAPLRAAITALASPLAAADVVDIGCGEGYYTASLAATAAGETVGIDIARDAIQRAARRYPGITWLVAGSARLPLADASADLVTSLFAPVPAAEIARVLRPGGHLLLAAPAADHLASLRAALFEDVRPHAPDKILASLGDGYVLREQREVAFPLALDNAALRQLLLMTPYAWRAKRERVDALTGQPAFTTTAAFTLYLLRTL